MQASCTELTLKQHVFLARYYIAESTSIIKAAFLGHTQSQGRILEDRAATASKQPQAASRKGVGLLRSI